MVRVVTATVELVVGSVGATVDEVLVVAATVELVVGVVDGPAAPRPVQATVVSATAPHTSLRIA
jgi:hypothetical protein